MRLLSAHPRQPISYLPASLLPFRRQPDRLRPAHRVGDEAMLVQPAHDTEIEAFPDVAPVGTEGGQQSEHGFFDLNISIIQRHFYHLLWC